MDVQHYKQRLLQLETEIAGRVQREMRIGREQTRDESRDAADEGVADQGASDNFAEEERDAALLQQVQDALKRIDDGTYGQCAVDQGPIEPKRLDAMPWTPYCLSHERLVEAAEPRRMPTL